MRPTFPTPARGALRLSVTAGLKKLYAVRDQDTGLILAEFDSCEDAARARQSGRDALAMLKAAFASAPSRRGAR